MQRGLRLCGPIPHLTLATTRVIRCQIKRQKESSIFASGLPKPTNLIEVVQVWGLVGAVHMSATCAARATEEPHSWQACRPINHPHYPLLRKTMPKWANEQRDRSLCRKHWRLLASFSYRSRLQLSIWHTGKVTINESIPKCILVKTRKT